MDCRESRTSSVGLKEGGKESSACSSFLLRAQGIRCVRVGCVEVCVGCAGTAAAAAAEVLVEEEEEVMVEVVVVAAGREV